MKAVVPVKFIILSAQS